MVRDKISGETMEPDHYLDSSAFLFAVEVLQRDKLNKKSRTVRTVLPSDTGEMVTKSRDRLNLGWSVRGNGQSKP